jgi:ABC-type nitrate/sulfonate/bicarbonate transport system substrate-binding protein
MGRFPHLRALAAAGALILSAAGSVASAAEPTITFASRPFYAPFAYFKGLELGSTAPKGFKIEHKQIFTETRNKMLMAGALDAGEMSLSTYLIARERGTPLVLLGTGTKNLEEGNALFVRADSAIKSQADLAGKKIGVESMSSVTTIYHRAILQHRYKVPTEKISWLVKPPPQLLALLKQGEIDAAVLFSDVYFTAKANPDYRIIHELGYEGRAMAGDYLPAMVIVAQERKLREIPGMGRELVAAMKRSFEYAAANQEALMAEWLKTRQMPPALLKRAWVSDQPSFSLTDKEKDIIMRVAEWHNEQNVLSRKLKAEEIFVPF